MDNHTTLKTAMETMLMKASIHWTKKAENKKFNASVAIGSLNNCIVYDLFLNGEMVYTASTQGKHFKPITFESSEIVFAFESSLKERLYK